MILFYKILGGNLGVAIVAFSLFLLLVLSPLTKPYMESMKKMKEMAPSIEKLKAKYKGDNKGFLQAQSELYRQKGINPGAGCLPYLLQIVVLIGMFNVFTTVLAANGDSRQKLNDLLYPPLRLSETESLNTTFLWLDLTKPDTINVPGAPFALPGLLLILASGVQFVSGKITAPFIEGEKKIAKGTPEKSDDFQTSMQQSMSYTLPIITLLVGMSFPSGLALYWFIFSFYQAYQQYKSSGWGSLTPFVRKLGLLYHSTQRI